MHKLTALYVQYIFIYIWSFCGIFTLKACYWGIALFYRQDYAWAPLLSHTPPPPHLLHSKTYCLLFWWDTHTIGWCADTESGLKAETVAVSHFSCRIQKYKRLGDLITVSVCACACACASMTGGAEKKTEGSGWYMCVYVREREGEREEWSQTRGQVCKVIRLNQFKLRGWGRRGRERGEQGMREGWVVEEKWLQVKMKV